MYDLLVITKFNQQGLSKRKVHLCPKATQRHGDNAANIFLPRHSMAVSTSRFVKLTEWDSGH